MSLVFRQAEVFNQTRKVSLATTLALADTHWTRLRGLLGTTASDFRGGCGLWILPCRGVHTLAMRFPIDAVYLDGSQTVVHIEQNLQPWRIAPVRMQASTVLELPCQTVASTGTAIGDKIEINVGKVTNKQTL